MGFFLFQISLHCLLPLFLRKNHYKSLLHFSAYYVFSLFPLSTFQIFHIITDIKHFYCDVPSYFRFLVLEVCPISWICRFKISPNLVKFSAIISLNIFSVLAFLSPLFEDSNSPSTSPT